MDLGGVSYGSEPGREHSSTVRVRVHLRTGDRATRPRYSVPPTRVRPSVVTKPTPGGRTREVGVGPVGCEYLEEDQDPFLVLISVRLWDRVQGRKSLTSPLPLSLCRFTGPKTPPTPFPFDGTDSFSLFRRTSSRFPHPDPTLCPSRPKLNIKPTKDRQTRTCFESK